MQPLQIYFIASGLLVAATTLIVRRYKRYDGQAALVGLLAFSASSAALEPLRSELIERTYWGPLPQILWVALAMSVATLALLAAIEVIRRPSLQTAVGVEAETREVTG